MKYEERNIAGMRVVKFPEINIELIDGNYIMKCGRGFNATQPLKFGEINDPKNKGRLAEESTIHLLNDIINSAMLKMDILFGKYEKANTFLKCKYSDCIARLQKVSDRCKMYLYKMNKIKNQHVDIVEIEDHSVIVLVDNNTGKGYVAKVMIETELPEDISDDEAVTYLMDDYQDTYL